jgi:hypothetical protein
MQPRHLIALLGVSLIPVGCTDDAPRFDFDHDGWEDAVDCVPDDPTVHPGADEVCDGKDNDCDGDVDEGFADNDTDGVATCAGDCDDNNPESFPGAEEICDGEDNDCDGHLPEDETDGDSDGWSECAGDCNDNNEALNLDDADGDGWSTCALDCDDTDAELNLDDTDGDGVDTCGSDGIPGTGDEDCDDNDDTAYPGAPELCDGVDSDCDGTDNDCVQTGTEDLSIADAKFLGEEPGDGAGRTVAGAGDVSGDGLDDLLVGARWNDTTADNAGAAYLLAAPFSGTVELSTSDAVILGEAADDQLSSGAGLSAAGDLNSDGYGDILLGASLNDSTGTNAGRAYLFYGPVAGVIDASTADASFDGEHAGDSAGNAVSYAGDVDQDGADDILIGAHEHDDPVSNAGAAYLYYGPVYGDLDLSTADAKLVGEEQGDGAGRSVSAAGDVNGDGYDDLLVGAYDQHTDGPGSAYLIHGPVYGNISLSSSDAILLGEEDGDRAGISVSSVGDMDSDGFDDVLIGAHYHDGTGAAYLLHGPISGTESLGSADAIVEGETFDDAAGFCVSGAGDYDGDGYTDVLMGAYQNDQHGLDSGTAYILYGPLGGVMNLSDADLILRGEAAGDQAGVAVKSVGDVNNDGYGDIVVGASQEDSGGTDAGAAYLLLGSGL